MPLVLKQKEIAHQASLEALHKKTNRKISVPALSLTDTMRDESPPSHPPSLAASHTTARREEIKYLLTAQTYHTLRAAIRPYTGPDLFACSAVCSLYFDTPDHAMVRRSLEKPKFKEKFRLRVYVPNPQPDDECFLEIKRKVKGVGFKRRIKMSYQEAITYSQKGTYPERTLALLSESERWKARHILEEMDWLFLQYGALRPGFMVSCKRLSLKEKGTDSLRITFDRDVCWDIKDDIRTLGNAATPLVDPEMRIMEIKTTGSMPLWLAASLDKAEVYPQSFSKVGNAYRAWTSLSAPLGRSQIHNEKVR